MASVSFLSGRREIAASQSHLPIEERLRENVRRYKKRHRERVLFNKRKYQRQYTLRTKFGMTTEEYQTLLLKQNGGCAICGHVPDEPTSSDVRYRKSKQLAVDHNHKTKKNRGLLCDKCNRGIGHFNDDANLLKTAIEYLKQYEA
jgi:hypothetical protein